MALWQWLEYLLKSLTMLQKWLRLGSFIFFMLPITYNTDVTSKMASFSKTNLTFYKDCTGFRHLQYTLCGRDVTTRKILVQPCQCTEVGFASFLSTFFCISMYKQMEAIFVSFWYLILTTLKEICGNLRFFELIGF